PNLPAFPISAMNDARALLLNRIVTERPEAEAWRALVASCRQEHGLSADLALTARLAGGLTGLDEVAREPVTPVLAEMLAEAEGAHLAALLATDEEKTARHLALEMLARLPGPLPAELLHTLRGLFLDRRLPE